MTRSATAAGGRTQAGGLDQGTRFVPTGAVGPGTVYKNEVFDSAHGLLLISSRRAGCPCGEFRVYPRRELSRRWVEIPTFRDISRAAGLENAAENGTDVKTTLRLMIILALNVHLQVRLTLSKVPSVQIHEGYWPP
jgi:hypothetical protein